MTTLRLAATLTFLASVMTSHAGAQLAGTHLDNAILVDVVPIGTSYATVVRTSSYIDDRSGSGGQILARPTVHVFGPGPREDSVFQFVPFQTPRRDTNQPETMFTRPSLRSGFVYCRLYDAPEFDQVIEEAQTRVRGLDDDLKALIGKADSLPDDRAELADAIEIARGELTRESEWLADLRTPRIALTDGGRDGGEPEPDPAEDPNDPASALRTSLFRLLIGYIIDGGVYSTDIVCYVHLGVRGNVGNQVPVFWIDMMLVDGTTTDVFKTPNAGSKDSTLSPQTPYVRYWVPYSDPESQPQREFAPKPFCDADAGVRSVFVDARDTFIAATYEAAASLPSCD